MTRQTAWGVTAGGVSTGSARSSAGEGATGILLLAGWVVFLAASLVMLHDLGGALAPPPLTEPGQWGRWLGAREPSDASFALVRLFTLGSAWYLLAATVVATAARTSGAVPLVRVADAVSITLVRRLAGGAVGVSITALAMYGAAGAAASAAQTGDTAGTSASAGQAGGASPSTTVLPGAAEASRSLPPIMRRLPDQEPGSPPAPVGAPSPVTTPPGGAAATSTTGATTAVPGSATPPAAATPSPAGAPSGTPPAAGPTTSDTTTPAPGTATPPGMGTASTAGYPSGLRPTTPRAVAGSPSTNVPTTSATSPVQPSATPPITGTPSGDEPLGRTWMVRPGDHLWSVSERVLAEAWGRAPSDDELDPYWRQVVEANRDRLHDPANADLVFPGQVLVVPAPPAPPG